jgi:AGCS family alanine or glycine:cation symporter
MESPASYLESVGMWIETAADWFAYPLVAVLMLTGLFFTLRLRFVQITRFGDAIRETIASRQSGASGPLSPLQAFMTSLAATIGTGNIAGVATAIVSGGPGALFWIWCYGFFAMATKFSEAVLGMHFRNASGDKVLSGPMYYLRDGVRSPALAWIFALVAGIGVVFTTPLSQTNSVAVVISDQLDQHDLALGSTKIGSVAIDHDRLIVGLVLSVLTWLVIVHGIKSIGRAAEALSPLKVGLYLIGGAIVIGINIAKLPAVLGLVFSEAFSMRAAAGGAAGWSVMIMAVRYGVARGVYANEAGYGTAAVAYGTAKSQHPEQQGLAAMMEVFLISFVTSSISALSILLTGVWTSGATSSGAVAKAFDTALPNVGGWMVVVSVFLFGYTVLIGWSFYGEQFFEFLFGPRVIPPYRWIYCALIPLGALAKVNAVWAWGDIFNGLQVFPNVIGLLMLSGIAASYARRTDRDSPKTE